MHHTPSGRSSRAVTDRPGVQRELIADLEETLEAQGYLPMYDFAWTLRGYDPEISAGRIEALSLEAYRDLTARIPMKLMWSTWPSDVDGAWEADPATKLDFDLDPAASVTEPYLLLVLSS